MPYYYYHDDDDDDSLTYHETNKKKSLRTKQQKRKERTQQLHIDLSVKPTFTPLYNYDIIHIHYGTSIALIHNLIHLAQKTHTFTIDTETDKKSHQAALIQIEFVVIDSSSQSIVLLIETCHLPNVSSVLFGLIRSLLKIIFKPSNTILSWGNAMEELIQFVPCHIIDFNTINRLHFINIQYYFKKWYNKTFVHMCGVHYNGNHLSCTCSYRPYKRRHEKWSLQQAIAYTFDEFLNKHCTFNNWMQGLDDHLHHDDNSSRHHRQNLIQYAVNDCLAVTKLSMVILNNWTLKQLQQYNTTSFVSH